MTVFEAFSLAFFVSSICIFSLLYCIFGWDFFIDLFHPKNLSYFKKKKVLDKKMSPLSNQGIPKENRLALESMLIPLIKGDESLLPARMDKVFREQIKHQIRFLKKKKISREFYFTSASCPRNFVK